MLSDSSERDALPGYIPEANRPLWAVSTHLARAGFRRCYASPHLCFLHLMSILFRSRFGVIGTDDEGALDLHGWT